METSFAGAGHHGVFAPLATRGADYGTVVLDRLGRIVSCGGATARLFGESAERLRGRDVAEFAYGISLGGTSARYRVGYLDYLAARPDWQAIAVRNREGGGFTAWFRVSSIVAEGQRLFLIVIRGPEDGGEQRDSSSAATNAP